MPPNGNVPIFSHPRLRNYLGSESVIPRESEVHREQPNDDDDDVFSTGTNPPCTLQDSQNRKRAHSAGDMGLLRPPHPAFTHGANYSGINPEICEPLAKKAATRVSYHPTTYNPTYPPSVRPPPPPYPTCYRETPTNIMSTRPKPPENHSRNPDVIDPLAQRKIVQNSIYSTNQSSSHQEIHGVSEPKTGVHVLNREENESTKKSDSTSKGTESSSNPKPEVSNKSSLTKKYNLLSRPHAVKKKVLWNDLDKRTKS
uniref:Uncharacterized protein n=1 Tax=Ciona savignyi TaxID=51511 RepID=H2YIU7_CIOSA